MCALRYLFALVLFAVSSVALAADWNPADAPLMTKWGKKVTPDNAWKEYPRPQLVRKEWQNLNGLWGYAISSNGMGAPPSFEDKILVPFPIESALSGVGKTVASKQVIWYHRTFEVPASWNKSRVLLHFEAVDWHTTVFVNGKQMNVLGEKDAEEHTGGFDPFSFDITDALKDGKNDLLVRVWDPTDTGAQPRGKQVTKPGGIWYTPVSGIWQTVWLEAGNKPGHVTGLKIDTDIEGKEVTVDIQLSQPLGDAKYTVAVFDGDRHVGTSSGPDRVVKFALRNENKLWTPENPHVYQVRVTVEPQNNKNGSDSVESYFAFREIKVAKDEKGIMRMMLNGKPVFQYGPLDQGWWPDGLLTPPSDEAMKYDLEVIKKLGFNMVRKHVKVEPARYYAHCDKLGLLVWQDMPSGGIPARGHHIGKNAPDAQFTDGEKKQFRKELKAMIDHLRFFPCIVVWVPFNEGWGQHDTNDILKWVKEYDPSRLVDGPSGWTDRGFGDMKDMHAYPGPNMFPVMPNRAIVLGEFGGLGLPLRGFLWKQADNWGYHVCKNELDLREQYHLLVRRLHPLVGRGLSAAVYTQTTDVEVEVNGFMTYDREVIKVEVEEVAKWHKALFGPPPEQRILVATAEHDEQKWRWTTRRPAKDWTQLEFDASQWKEDLGGFGSDTPSANVRTKWTTPDIWIRANFELKEIPAAITLRMQQDDYAEVYINGVQVLKLNACTIEYVDYQLSPEAMKAFKKGTNVIAVHCYNTGGPQYVDAGLIEAVEKK